MKNIKRRLSKLYKNNISLKKAVNKNNHNDIIKHLVDIIEHQDILISECKSQNKKNKLHNDNSSLKKEKNAILNNSLFGLFKIKNFKFDWINEKINEITGYKKDFLLGRNISILFKNKYEYLMTIKKALSYLNQNKTYTNEVYLRKNDNSIIWSKINCIKINSDRIEDGVIVILEDINKNKNIEKALSQNERNTKTILNTVQSSFLLIDKDLNIKAFNRIAKEHIKKYTNKTLKEGYIYKNLITNRYKDRILSNIEKALNGNNIKDELLHYDIENNSQSEKWYEFNFQPVSLLSDKIDGVCISALDITKRKNAYKELQYKEKLLETVAKITSLLLKSIDYENFIFKLFQILGYYINIDRIFILKRIPLDDTGKSKITIFSDWLNEDINIKNINLTLYKKLINNLLQKSYFNDKIQRNYIYESRNLSENSNYIINNLAIDSILIQPIYVHDFLWGFIFFENIEKDKTLSENEISIIQIAINSLGNAIERKDAFRLIENTNNKLEEIVEDRTNKLLYANKELLHKEEILKAILNNIPDNAWLKDENGKYITINKSFERTYNISNEAIYGKTNYQIIPFERASKYENDDNEVKKTKKALIIEEKIKQKDKNIWIETIKTPIINNQGDVIGITGISRNITKYKEMENFLKESQEEMEKIIQKRTKELENANKAKSEFLANISHEIRTPLNVILGYTQMLLKDYNIDERKKEDLRVILKSSDHLLNLINDILDISKIEAGKFNINKGFFNLKDFLKNIIEIFHIRSRMKDISFVYKELSELPDTVYGDERRIRQVLINILGNAVKFTNKGSIIFKVDYYNNKIFFEIEDTGIGMKKEDIDKIFKPFHQTTNNEIMNKQGSGLGLSISQRLVEMMNSKIYVFSQLGKGSRFWFELDLPASNESVAYNFTDNKKIIGFKGKKKNILIVDDNKENRDIIYWMLKPLGFKIKEAVDSKTTFEILKVFKPEIIFLDIILPDINGFEIANTLRKNEMYKDTIIIAVSANVFENTRIKSKKSGCNDFLGKPIWYDSLLRMIEKYIDIEWEYEHKDKKDIPEFKKISDLTKNDIPELDILNNILECAKMGDIKAIDEEIIQIERQNEKYLTFTNMIRNYTKDFQLSKVEKFIEEFKEMIDE